MTRNLDVTVARPGCEYRGTGELLERPGLDAELRAVPRRHEVVFRIDGRRVVMDKIEIVTDGARSSVHGDINLQHWPEQSFRVESTYDLRRMRELFFANEDFELSGNGRFEGYFHLFKEPMPDGTNRTGRELFGTFASARPGSRRSMRRGGPDTYRFNDLRGSVRWTPERLGVTDASASLYGGAAQFSYDMAPLGKRGVRPTATFAADYGGLSVREFSDLLEARWIASGRNGGRAHRPDVAARAIRTAAVRGQRSGDAAGRRRADDAPNAGRADRARTAASRARGAAGAAASRSPSVRTSRSRRLQVSSSSARVAS